MAYNFYVASDAQAVDIRLLRYRDRATLRILDRAEAATARQLAILVYGHIRIAQRRLAALWQAGLVERAGLPLPGRGGPEYAYRLSRLARQRLGDQTNRTRGSNRLGHTLDIVETVCTLTRSARDPLMASPVQAWLAESAASELLGGPPYPDSILVLSDGSRSCVICLEIDEATQRAAIIAAKLRGYRRLLESQHTWLVLFVVPTRARASWMRNAAPSGDLGTNRTWVTTLPVLGSHALDAPVVALAANRKIARLRDLIADPHPRNSDHPVASHAWLRMLGEGGSENLEGLLW